MELVENKYLKLFILFPPTSRQFQLISVTSGFTRLIMKTKYVCRGLISLYVNFHNNRTMWSTNLHVKICRWGGVRKKSPRADLGGGRTSFFSPPQGFDPLPTQRVPHFTILRYPYLVTDRKNFLKAPWAIIYTNFEWGAPADLLVETFQKVPKNAFFDLFFKISPALPKKSLFKALGELGKSIWST